MNRLRHENSPYLLQHASNPIDWYPWGEEAFEHAQKEQKMIFLSIGYSTCHWCHVMEKESFADPEVASYLNRHYISIKVDREERTDLDQVYMAACQLLSGQGGWPLTVVLTPDKHPIFAGTYFPKRRKWGKPGLMDILTQLFVKWFENRERVIETAAQIVQELSIRTMLTPNDATADVLDIAAQAFQKRFDPENGGFGQAPKFPSANAYLFLMRDYMRTNDQQTLHMIEHSLQRMAKGGIYDQLGGGFARYSTDAKWLVPHFEKMLSDNALLLMVYIEAYQLTNDPFYREIALGIVQYVEKNLKSEDGLWFTAEDADSDGEEGAFYLWTPEQISLIFENQASSLTAQQVCTYFGVTAQGHFNQKSVLHRPLDFENAEHADQHIEKKYGLFDKEEAIRLLNDARSKRNRPHRDEKCLTAWNALMIAALAKGGAGIGIQNWIARAEEAMNALQIHLRDDAGRWLTRYCAGQRDHLAVLNDYAFLMWASLELMNATGKVMHLKFALELAEQLHSRFWNETLGGFEYVAHDAEQPFFKLMDHFDGALPSGNAVIAWCFLRLSQITLDSKWADMSEKIQSLFSEKVEEAPTAHAMHLIGLDWRQGMPQDLVLVGELSDSVFDDWVSAIQKRYLPFLNLIVLRETERDEWEQVTALCKGKVAMFGKPTAYLCEDGMCLAPYTKLDDLLKRLEATFG